MGFSSESILPVIKTLGDQLIGVEVGVCKGKNIKALMDNCDNIRKLYGVDPWEEYTDNGNYHSQEECDSNRSTAMMRLKDFMADCSLDFIPTHSKEAVKRFRDNSIDFVFIDGNHSTTSCYEDICLWFDKVKPGGLVAGHDYRPKDLEVRGAVKMFIEKIRLEYGYAIRVVDTGTCWYFYKKGEKEND